VPDFDDDFDIIEDLSSFFAWLKKQHNSPRRVEVFRGHPDHEFILHPGIFRKSTYRIHENNVFRELISIHPDEFREDHSTFDELVRMQHVSLPTRLLDVTYNPLVALFFACVEIPDQDGEFIIIETSSAKVKYFDSDAVSCVSNLSHLSARERRGLSSIDDFSELQESAAGKRLLQFIRVEKPYFLPEIQPHDLKSVWIVKPKQSNRRILAQQGAFLLFGLLPELLDDNDFNLSLTRVRIPASSKPKILADLDRVSINRRSLFPEIETAAKYIMTKIPPPLALRRRLRGRKSGSRREG
jgi:FRG domain